MGRRISRVISLPLGNSLLLAPTEQPGPPAQQRPESGKEVDGPVDIDLAPRLGQLSLEVEGIQILLDGRKPGSSEAESPDVKLDYTRSPVLFQARALTLIDESRVKYRYQLEGLDETAAAP